jgi:hypothetical protein
VPSPSWQDDASMMKILFDQKVGANFVVLMVAKMAESDFVATATLYTRSGRSTVDLVID